jgi:pimeloyl-ACP methyl ester carboxylesterase
MTNFKYAALVLSLCLCSGALQAQSPTPTLITVNGHKVHVAVEGQGKPAVIFESGLGEDFSTWDAVRPQVAKSTLTLAYDRSGLGLSEATAGKPDGMKLTSELHDLLQIQKIPPPYILVGHSLGGTLVQIFARRFPREVAALVLVDPEDGRIVHQLEKRLSKEEWQARSETIAKFGAMPPVVKNEYDAMVATGAEVEKLGPLPRVPIVLLTGTQVDKSFPGNPEEQEIKIELHRQFVAANPQTEQVMVPESRHYIQAEAPDKVIAAIDRVLAQTKTQMKKF